MRGEEWVSSAPKHLLLYQYFGWEPPELMHLPLLRNPDKSKLSKRKNPTGILFYRAMGYLPEALLNFLGLLAMPAREGEDEAHGSRRDGRAVSNSSTFRSAARFSTSAKLDWLNGRYLRERLDRRLVRTRRARAWAISPQRLTRIAPLAAAARRAFQRSRSAARVFFSGRLSLDARGLLADKLEEQRDAPGAGACDVGLSSACRRGTRAASKARSDASLPRSGRKPREIARPFYVAMTGSPTSIPLYDSMELLGRDMARERLRDALDAPRRADKAREGSAGSPMLDSA